MRNPTKELSLKKRIVERLKEIGTWVHKGKIEERAKEWGYLAETSNRRLRELENEKIIEVKQENGSDLYRYKPQPKTIYTTEVINGIAYPRQKVVLV